MSEKQEVEMNKRYCINCGWRVANRFCMKHLIVILLDRYCKFWKTKYPGLFTNGDESHPTGIVVFESPIHVLNSDAKITLTYKGQLKKI
jgi:hypothetical protein